VHYLIFEKLKFSSTDCVQIGPMHHPAKFYCQSLNSCMKMAYKKFNWYSNNGRPPSWVYRNSNF